MPFWSAYRKIGEPVIIEGISVRFISQIPLKENEKPSKYVQKVHKPLNGLILLPSVINHFMSWQTFVRVTAVTAP
jgi:uncharacterized protein (TIGR04255 family)